MRCKHCKFARAMAPSATRMSGSMYRLCADCAYDLAPLTTRAWFELRGYRYKQYAMTPAQEAATRARIEEEEAHALLPA